MRIFQTWRFSKFAISREKSRGWPLSTTLSRETSCGPFEKAATFWNKAKYSVCSDLKIQKFKLKSSLSRSLSALLIHCTVEYPLREPNSGWRALVITVQPVDAPLARHIFVQPRLREIQMKTPNCPVKVARSERNISAMIASNAPFSADGGGNLNSTAARNAYETRLAAGPRGPGARGKLPVLGDEAAEGTRLRATLNLQFESSYIRDEKSGASDTQHICSAHRGSERERTMESEPPRGGGAAASSVARVGAIDALCNFSPSSDLCTFSRVRWKLTRCHSV